MKTVFIVLVNELACITCIICSAFLFYHDHSVGWLFAVLALLFTASYKSTDKKKDPPLC